MKRKWMFGAAAAVLVLCAGAGSVLASGSSRQMPAASDTSNTAVVSKVCTGPCGGSYTDENGDGICDYCTVQQAGTGCRSGYTDADGDGVCDNRGQQRSTGGRHAHGRHRAGCGQQ